MKNLVIIALTLSIIIMWSCASNSSNSNDTNSDTTSIIQNMTEDLDSESLHFKFMGIPIDGKIDQFGRLLKDKGFHLQESGSGHYGEYWGKFYDDYVYINVGYETRNGLVYEVEVTFENKSIEERQEILDTLIRKYSSLGAYVREDTDGDYEIIIWVYDGKHKEFENNRISANEVKGVIVFENDGNDLILRYIDVFNKTIHFSMENDDL